MFQLPIDPRRDRIGVNPEPSSGSTCFGLERFKHRIGWGLCPIPPAPSVFDEELVHIRLIRKYHLGNKSPVLIFFMRVNRDGLTEGQDSRGKFCPISIGLALLRAVDSVQANLCGLPVRQDFNGVTVFDGYDQAGEREGRGTAQKKEKGNLQWE